MLEDSESYRLARFASAAAAEPALRCLAEAGIECGLVAESDGRSAGPLVDEPVHLVCGSSDRIQAIVTLERARVI